MHAFYREHTTIERLEKCLIIDNRFEWIARYISLALSLANPKKTNPKGDDVRLESEQVST